MSIYYTSNADNTKNKKPYLKLRGLVELSKEQKNISASNEL